MRTTGKIATGVAALATATVLGLGIAGSATAATTTTPGTCTGTGPAATLSQAQHDAFSKRMTALKAERDAIMAKYGKSAPVAGQGAGMRARGVGRGSGVALSTEQRTAMQKELAVWRVKRDALFAEYGLTPRNPGRGA